MPYYVITKYYLYHSYRYSYENMSQLRLLKMLLENRLVSSYRYISSVSPKAKT